MVKLFKHEMDAVRKRSLCAMHRLGLLSKISMNVFLSKFQLSAAGRLYQMDKKCVADHLVKIRSALCDKGQ